MSRLPFDPKKMNTRAVPRIDAPSLLGAVGDRDAAPVSVSQLATMVERSLRDHLPPTVRVLGEIGQFRERSHWYFDLKDEGAVISCVMFAGAARKVGFVPRIGQQVVLSGRVEFYGKQGRTQFMADKLLPIGEGALDAAFRNLCDELRGLGWFDESRKRALPLFPRRVGVITSRTGAALQDVLDTARRRCPAIPIALIDARVQGDGAAEQLAIALHRLAHLHDALGVDVVLITRGGGSMEDLWCFNDRSLAQAILNSPIPVVAAIGHETDTTIAELVADLRGATPTQAAMRIFPDADDLRRQLASMSSRIGAHASRRVRVDRERLRGLASHPFLSDPETMIVDRRDDLADDGRRLVAAARSRVRDGRARLDRIAARLERHRPGVEYARREAALLNARSSLNLTMAVRLRSVDLRSPCRRLRGAISRLIDRRQVALESLARGLDLVGPHSVLSRGFSMTLHTDGRVVRSAGEVMPGQTVQTRLADGGFASVVQGVAGEVPSIGPAPAVSARKSAARRTAKSKSPPPDQLDLFAPGR